MLHDDRLLPSRTVLPQGFHLGGEGAGQMVEGVFVGLVLRQLSAWARRRVARIMATWVVAI
jgi:hypothetical protein